MVFTQLEISGEFEGISELIVPRSNQWALSIQSPDGENSRDLVTISVEDEIDIDGSRGVANFVISWPGSHNQGWIKVVDPSPFSSFPTSSDHPTPLVVFESRGVDIVGWHPSTDIQVVSEGGYVFDDVDLGEGEWADYDEENDQSVSILNFSFHLSTYKQDKKKKKKSKK